VLGMPTSVLCLVLQVSHLQLFIHHYLSSRDPILLSTLLIYVDDIIVISSTDVAISRLIYELQVELSIKDLSTLHYFLEIEMYSPLCDSIIL
jgi:hypothetical protein